MMTASTALLAVEDAEPPNDRTTPTPTPCCRLPHGDTKLSSAADQVQAQTCTGVRDREQAIPPPLARRVVHTMSLELAWAFPRIHRPRRSVAGLQPSLAYQRPRRRRSTEACGSGVPGTAVPLRLLGRLLQGPGCAEAPNEQHLLLQLGTQLRAPSAPPEPQLSRRALSSDSDPVGPLLLHPVRATVQVPVVTLASMNVPLAS